MYDKIAPLLQYFARNSFFIENTGAKVKTESKTELLYLYNSARSTINMTPIDLPGLSNKLKNPSEAFKRHLVYALGLDELGFGTDIWEHSAPDILKVVKSAIEESILETLSAQPQNKNLIKVLKYDSQGIEEIDPARTFSSREIIERIIVKKEDGLNVQVNLPFHGYIRILALENGRLYGLNERLDIKLNQQRPASYENLPTIPLSRTVPNTTLIALATYDEPLNGWPSTMREGIPMSYGDIFESARKFTSIDHTERACRLISVVTA